MIFSITHRVASHLERLHDELPDVDPRALIVVDRITHVAVHPSEQVENRQELRIIYTTEAHHYCQRRTWVGAEAGSQHFVVEQTGQATYLEFVPRRV